jgi:cyclase
MSLRRPRLIPRLDIKGPNVVKGICFEGLRVVGNPQDLAKRYAEDADELLYIDTVATLYGRSQLEPLIEKTVEEVFIPITVGGGIRSNADAKRLLDAGADKLAINTAALQRPEFINELSSFYGSQAIVVSIEAKSTAHGWEAYTDNGRERTGKNAVAWAFEAVERGAGELLITSIDRDGTRRGFDLELIRAIAPHVPVPVIAGGGMGTLAHLRSVVEEAKADAVAVGTVLHYGNLTIERMRNGLAQSQLQTGAGSEGGRKAA